MDKRQARSEIERIVAIEDDINFADRLMDLIHCSEEEQYRRLPTALRTAVAVNAFSLETNGGGLYQLLANTAPGVVKDILESLERILASEAKRLLEGLRSRFPNGRIPEDAVERLKLLAGLESPFGGQLFRELDREYRTRGENVLALLKAYVSKHKDEVATELASWRPQPRGYSSLGSTTGAGSSRWRCEHLEAPVASLRAAWKPPYA